MRVGTIIGVVTLLAWLGAGCNALPLQAARPTVIPTRDGALCAELTAERDDLAWTQARFAAAQAQLGDTEQLQAAADTIKDRYFAITERRRKTIQLTLLVTQTAVADAVLNARSVFNAWDAGHDGQYEAANYLTALKIATETISSENRIWGCW